MTDGLINVLNTVGLVLLTLWFRLVAWSPDCPHLGQSSPCCKRKPGGVGHVYGGLCVSALCCPYLYILHGDQAQHRCPLGGA